MGGGGVVGLAVFFGWIAVLLALLIAPKHHPKVEAKQKQHERDGRITLGAGMLVPKPTLVRRVRKWLNNLADAIERHARDDSGW